MKVVFLILVIYTGDGNLKYEKIPFAYSLLPITCDEMYEKKKADAAIFSIRWSPDYRLIAAGLGSGRISVYDGISGHQRYNVNSNPSPPSSSSTIATTTDGATVTWDMSTQSVCKLTLGGNRTISAPTNGSTGQFASILVIQDGTGSRSLTWNAAYEFASDTAPTLTTTASLGDLFTFRYNGSGKIRS